MSLIPKNSIFTWNFYNVIGYDSSLELKKCFQFLKIITLWKFIIMWWKDNANLKLK